MGTLKKSSNRHFGLVDLFTYGVVDRLFVYVCPINSRSSLARYSISTKTKSPPKSPPNILKCPYTVLTSCNRMIKTISYTILFLICIKVEV